MTDVEHETRVFLRELDTFGQPPPRQKLIDSDYNDGRNTHSRLNNCKEFTQKLDTINLAKQALSERSKRSNEPVCKPGPSSISTQYPTKKDSSRQSNQNGKDEISKDEIQKWKDQVLSASRPINRWYETQHQSPVASSQYARSPTLQQYRSHTDNYSSNNINENHTITDTRHKYEPINITTQSTNPLPNAFKSQQLPKAPSLSPLSPVSNNTETSVSSLSTGSYGTSSWEKGKGVYYAKLYNADDNLNLSNDLLQNPNQTQAPPQQQQLQQQQQQQQQQQSLQTAFSTLQVSEGSDDTKLMQSTLLDERMDRDGREYQNRNLNSVIKSINGNKTRIIMNSNSKSNKSGADQNSSLQDTHYNGSAISNKQSDRMNANRTDDDSVTNHQSANQSTSTEPMHSTGPPWRNKAQNARSMSQSTLYNSSNERQHRKFEEITQQIQKQLDIDESVLGMCDICGKEVTDETQVTCALGKIYHKKCFVCDMCGRTLCGKKFYKTRGKTYCEEDYLYSGMHETAERCAACSHLIVDMVLQALGKSYHPKCFRCEVCRRCLDGIPFAVDDYGKVYCMEDYHTKFAPKCFACHKPIMPAMDSGETVRVVAIDKDYHVECYVCEGCGMQLTDEPEKRCYPLNAHLLCKKCHRIWATTGGDEKPITDL